MHTAHAHHYPLDAAAARVEGAAARVVRAYALARTSHVGLHRVVTSARDHAGLATRTGLAAAVREDVVLCGRAAAGLLACAGQVAGTVRFAMRDGDLFTLPAIGPYDLANAATWLTGFHAALATGDLPALDRMASMAVGAMEALPGIQVAPYVFTYVRCLQAVWTEDRTVGARLEEAIAQADPDALEGEQAAWALHVDLPALEVLFRMHLRDVRALESAIEHGLAAHRRYWSASARALDPIGIIALPIAGMVALARRRAGLAPRVASPYLPPALLATAD